MIHLYKFLGLFERIVLKVSLGYSEILNLLTANLDKDTGMEFIYDLKKKRYKLKIEENYLRIKESKKFEESETRQAYVIGNIYDQDKSTILEFNIYIKPANFLLGAISNLLLIIILTYGIAVLEGNSRLMAIILLVLVPVAIGRTIYEWYNTLRKMKYEFERELQYILSGNKSPNR